MEVFSINASFRRLEEEKQERIINAALDEFVRSGYERASTNEIVKRAGISKGSLFNYFQSKKDLYLFLHDHVAAVIELHYAEMDWNETDYFERLKLLGEIKVDVMRKFPQFFNFMKSFHHEDAAKKRLQEGFEKVYDNIDWSKFRDDVDLEKMVRIMNWTMIGFAEEQMKRIDRFEEIGMELFDEWYSYADFFKRFFYK